MPKSRKTKSKPLGLYEFLERLRAAQIHFDLASYREDTIMVQIAVPGERWEVEFFASGAVEIERFRNDGTITDPKELEFFFPTFGETNNLAPSITM
jgi:hypothetical protein